MNRISEKNRQLRLKNKKAFVAYITAGFPDIRSTEKLVCELEKSDVDFIELGMPFSDPVADGPTIQAASAAALKKGMTLKKFLALVSALRKKTQIPLIIMSYYNPILRYGLEKFASDAEKCGLDGVIVPDLPPEEAGQLNDSLNKNGVAQIFLISPVTTKQRMKKIAAISKGFIYYVPLTGVTGVRNSTPKGIGQSVKLIKSYSDTPVFVGFGISNAKQVKEISRISDGVIVGSGIIRVIEENAEKASMVSKVGQYVRTLTGCNR